MVSPLEMFEHLRHARIGGAFAFAGDVALRPAKGFEKIGIGRDIRQLHGAPARREFPAAGALERRGTPVTSATASSNTSAIIRRG